MQRRYLKDAVNKAGYSSQPLSVFERLDRASVDAMVELMALLTRRLVLGEEGGDGMDDGSTVLHFVPTMMMIEGLYRLLEDMLPGVPLYVLHSSIDIDDCMAALMGEDGAPVRHCSSNWAAAATPLSHLRFGSPHPGARRACVCGGRVLDHHQEGGARHRLLPFVRDTLGSHFGSIDSAHSQDVKGAGNAARWAHWAH